MSITRHPQTGRWLFSIAGIVALAAACGSEPPDPGTDAAVSPGEEGGSAGVGGTAGAGGEVQPPDEDAGPEAQATGGTGGAPDAGAEAESPEADALDEDAAEEPDTWGCGDGFRDPAMEECDDGLGDLQVPRACSPECYVVDHLLPWNPDVEERRLGTGRHPSAAGVSGQAVATIEHVMGQAEPRVQVSTWTPVGSEGTVSWIDNVPLAAGPVLASLQDGSYAIAFASLGVDGDGLGVALTRVTADGASPAPPIAANETAVFAQHSPDIVSIGQQVVVAWQDDSTSWGSTVCWRRFDHSLKPVALPHCEPDDGAFRSRPVLCATGDSLTVAWREDTGLTVFIEGGTTESVPFEAGTAPADELVAITGVDSDHALVVYTEEGGAQMSAVVNRLQGLTGAGVVKLNSGGPPRHDPTLASAGGAVYLAWREPVSSPPTDGGWSAEYDELFVQKLVWNGQTLDASSAPISLPRREVHRVGDQVRPSLVSVPLAPGGGILAAWEDLFVTNFDGQSKYADVVLELIPTPILRTAGVQ